MRRVIEESLDACEVFLLIWSKNSVGSREVQIEINHAHTQNKPIISLQLDNSEAPKGINMILRSYQFVPSLGSEKERYTKLGVLMLSAYGLAKNDSIKLVNIAWKKRLQERRLQDLDKKRNIEAWEDKYWELHWDSSRDRARRLTLYDNDCLSALATRLDIDPTQLKRIKTRFKRSRQVFARSLQKALTADFLSENDIVELEKLRVQCCISKTEVHLIVSRTSLKSKFAADEQQLPEALTWWFLCLFQGATQFSEAEMPVSTTPCDAGILDLSAGVSGNPLGLRIKEDGSTPISSDTVPARDKIQDDGNESKLDQPARRLSHDAFSGFQSYLLPDDPFLLAAARLICKPGMETKVISMAKESLMQKKTSDAYLLVGTASYLLGYLMDAISFLQLAIATEKRVGDEQRMALCHNMLGVVRLSLSDFNGAWQEFTSAVERDRSQPAYLFNRALVSCFLEDGNPRSDLDAFFGNSHARTSCASLFGKGLAAAVLSSRKGCDENVINELRSLPPLLPSTAQIDFISSNEVEQSIVDVPTEPEPESLDSAMIDRDVVPFSVDTASSALIALIWDWRVEEQQLDPSSCFELHACQRRASELLHEMVQSLLACHKAIVGFSATYGLGFLRCAPEISVSSRTLKAIRKLSLEGKQTGRPLLHFGENCFQLRHGFVLFERGMAICSATAEFCWYPFNASSRDSVIKFSLERGTGSLLIATNLLDGNGISRQSSTYRFSSFLVRSNQPLMKSLQLTSALLESREAAWMGIRKVIRTEMGYLRLFCQGIMSTSVTKGLGRDNVARVRATLGYQTLLEFENDLLFIVCACNERESLLSVTRAGLSCVSPGAMTHFKWNEVLSLNFIAVQVGSHFRINGSRNVQWARAASEFGLTADDMISALGELCTFIMSLKPRLCQHC